MRKIATYLNASTNWRDRIVLNPDTGNKVKVKSLPKEQQERYNPNKITKNNIADEAKKGNANILLHPHATKPISSDTKTTPLHLLALAGNEHVLHHPKVDSLKGEDGNTPLHYLAGVGSKKALNHPSLAKVKNRFDETPLHIMSNYGHEIAKKHPEFKNIKDNEKNTPDDYFGKKNDMMAY